MRQSNAKWLFGAARDSSRPALNGSNKSVAFSLGHFESLAGENFLDVDKGILALFK